MTGARRGAVIFDRDGVLNVDVAYAHRPDQITWTPEAREAVAAVTRAGLFAFVATNQSGVARGYFGEAEVLRLHAWMERELAAGGGRVDAFAYCPHHPEGIVPAYRRACACRKPAPGLLTGLLESFGVAAEDAVMIGDQPTDAAAAAAAGVAYVPYAGGSLLDALAPALGALATRVSGPRRAPGAVGVPS